MICDFEKEEVQYSAERSINEITTPIIKTGITKIVILIETTPMRFLGVRNILQN